MDAEIKTVDLESKDLVAERIEQMKELFPEIATEGDGSIDFEKLRLILGDEVDEGNERYAFAWPGKANAIRQSQAVSNATLRPCPEESVDWGTTQNLYIEGDNLEVLKLLQRGYHGKVNKIYIDPPYNTGHDFVYSDSFGDSIANYKKQAGLTDQSNADTSGSYHSAWCSMMYPRLKLARELLSDNGVLFVSIDDHEVNALLSMCNELFGEKNHIETVIWKNKYGAGAKTVGFISVHEYIVCFSKKPIIELTSELDEEGRKRFNKRDSNYSSRGGYMTQPLMTASLADRPNLMYSIEYQGETIYPRKQWVWSKERLEEAIAKGEVEFSKQADGTYSVRSKSYLYDEEGKMRRGKPTSLMSGPFNQVATEHIRGLFDGKNVFDFTKPYELVEYLISLEINNTSNSTDIVMDFFSGSSATAEAVMVQNAKDGGNRRFIMVQLPEPTPEKSEARRSGFANLCEIGKERIRRAGAKVAAEVEESNRQLKIGEEPKPVPDIGFRVLKLDESGIARPEPGQLILDRVKEGRSDEDIIFEMMLKWGLELTYPIEKIEVSGYPCYSVAGDALVCCMQDGLTVEIIQAIADMAPDRVFMLDSILTDTLKLNAVQIFKRAEERTQQKIDFRTV